VVILFPFGKEKVTAHQAKAAWIEQPNLLPIEREKGSKVDNNMLGNFLRLQGKLE
jgi:hypothetical protein